jgi:peptidyl-dipeptidase Dcp
MDQTVAVNKSLVDWQGPLGLPQFRQINDEDFEPAFEFALLEHNREIDAITNNAAAPDITNTIVALELAGKALSNVSAIFWTRASAHTNDRIGEIERDISQVLSRHYSRIAQNSALFSRIETIWNNRESLDLDTETFRVLEQHYKGFVRAGALLDNQGQTRLAEINQRLALLGTQFGQNVLADESNWFLHLQTADELAGLPPFLHQAMAQAAREHGHESGYCVTLSRSIIEPFLIFSERRDLREIAFRAWISRGEGDNDNRPIIAEILKLRNEKARLLGYSDYAEYKLEDTMAKTAEAVNGLLMPVWHKAIARADEEAQALTRIIAEKGANHRLEAWDWRHYAEQERQRRFEFTESEVKPYFQLDNMIEAAFEVANRLFDIRFQRRTDIDVWHDDVRTFEMLDSDGNVRAIFFADYFARSTKRSGAWMSRLQSAHKLDGGQMPFIVNVMNFAKASPGEPVLLSLDDARTLFHEFGHALHGLLSTVTFPSISGTSVARDFVELPSQLFEHWLTVPEILEQYAVHYETGTPIPQELVAKIKRARTFNSGFQTVEFAASALVDMAYHTAGEVADPSAFESQTLAALQMPREIVMRHRSPHFLHIFSGDGYSAGYYSYLWSEVLDADAFQAFKEAGDPFSPESAKKLKQFIYESGGAMDPEDAYKAFRGRMPTPQAMLKGRGLV